MATAEEPWLGKKDWAGGCIRGSAGSLVGALLFAGVWNGFCAMICFLFLHNRTGRADDQVFWWFIIPFTITGLGLLWWAGAPVLRWRRYGRSVFQMASVPGVIGGQLAGVVRAAVKIEPQNTFRVRLTCTNCATTRNGRISRSLVWQDEQCITHDLLQRDAGHSAIPVLFQIMYYDLIIVCGDGKRVTAGKRLPGHRLAISVIRQIEQAMGKQVESVPATFPGGKA